MENMERLVAAIEKLADALMSAAPAGEPDYRYPLRDYFEFDWGSLGATPVASDPHGATRVSHGGKLYTRRAGAGKFGEAIWFSRATGTGEDGTEYARLITFKDTAPPEPLPPALASLGEGKHKLPPAPAGWVKAPAPQMPAAGWRTVDSPPLFEYKYGDGSTVSASNDAEKNTFNEYRRTHGEEPPPSRAGLRAWYALQKQAET